MRIIKRDYIFLIFLIALTLIVFHSWFTSGTIVGGDLSFRYHESFVSSYLMPYVWKWSNNSGFGGFNAPFLGIHYNSILINLLGLRLGLSWEILVRITQLFPFLFLSFFSSIYIFRKVFTDNKFWFLAPLIFVFNSYILMVVGGGQIILALSYAISPLILYFYTKFLNNLEFNPKNIILGGLLLSVQVMFDLRITYITLFAVGIYWIISVFLNRNKNYIFKSLFFVSLTFFVAGLIHAFWLLPTLFFHQNPLQQLGSAYTTEGAVRFFSFAKFEDAISLLHPNWPENIFGKVGFMKPEFLLLPILAYSSLFFVKKESKEKRKYILFFSIISLLGAFLAKGANEPFGGIYLWMFNHVPGFMMFRDPTKWYTLVAVSYSILIPYSIWNIYSFLSSKFKVQSSKLRLQFKIQKFIPSLFLLFVVLYLLFLISPALMGQLTGTFKTTTVPSDYIKLEKFLSSDDNFYRTFWIPTTQKFTFSSITHPAVNSENYFKTTDYSQILKKMRTPEIEKLLQESGVKYVIVPYDSLGQIFLSNRKYNQNLYFKTVSDVKKTPWLKEIKGFGKIAVFEVPNPTDHFYISNQPSATSHQPLAISNQKVKYKYISPVEYRVEVKNAKKGDIIIFSENYDARWMATALPPLNVKLKTENVKIESTKFDNRFNSFVLPSDGNYDLKIYYTPQDFVNIGLVISTITLISTLSFLIFNYRFRNNKLKQ